MIRIQSKKMALIPLACIAPAFILILVFKLYPILATIGDSFVYKASISLTNYRYLFSDPSFWNSLWVTFKFNIVTTPLQILLALALALLVNQKVKGITIFRTLYYFPVTISITVATIIWGMMFNQTNGLINGVLALLGISPQPFLNSPSQALWCLVVIASWKGIGYWMMFLLAGLQGIDPSVYEAARIDGSSWWGTTLKITIPLLKNSLLFVTVADTTANLLLFAPMYIITKGGPAGSTNVLMYEAYKSSFLYVDRPRAAAVMSVLLFIIALVVGLQFLLMNYEKKQNKAGGN